MGASAERHDTGSAEEFAKRKSRVLKGLLPQDAADESAGPDTALGVHKEAANIRPDRSLKGAVDALLVPLCAFLNAHPDYVTTSCCSGRITAYQQAHAATGKRVKSGGRLVYVSHEPVDVRDSHRLLQEILQGCRHYPEKKTEKETATGEAAAALPTLSHTDLKFEPLILHVEAATQAAALALLRVAVASGLRESGISALGKRNLVAIRGSQRMEAPLTLRASPALPDALGCTYTAQPGVTWHEETVLVTPAYFSSLLFLCNEKLKSNERQLNRLYEALQQELAHTRIQMTEPPSCGQRDRSTAQRSAQPASCSASPAAASSASDANNTSSVDGALAAEATTDKFVGVREARHLKTVKSALEALGLFDKSRKMRQVDLKDEEKGTCSVTTPQPPPGTSYLKLLPVRGPVTLLSLPVDVRNSVVLSTDADQLQLFSSSPVSNSLPCKQSIVECLDTLLRSACESTPNGHILLQQALQLRCRDSSLCPVAGDAADAAAAGGSAAGGPLVSWPHKFEKVGDVILLPNGSHIGFQEFAHLGWRTVGAAQMASIEARVWGGLCKAYGAKAVGVQAAITGRMRESRARLVFGSSGLTTVKENGVLFTLDVTKCMFASGNGTERLRFRTSLMRGEGPPETVVDLFCGIGYFSLGAASFVPPHRLQHIYACDINPNALQVFYCLCVVICKAISLDQPPSLSTEIAASDAAAAAREVLRAAPCRGACTQEQINQERKTASVPAALVGKVDRLSLGLIPSSEEAWPTAVSLLNDSKGGILHIHGVAPLEAVEDECCAVYVHPDQQEGEAAPPAPCASDYNKKTDMQVGGNCKLGRRLRFAQHALKQVAKLVSQKAVKTKGPWEVSIRHVEKVKSYAPKLFHFVVDIEARPSSLN
ncbi:hypothetical protein ACSSS7_000958 [Eimeria intestinalis]